MKMKQKVLTFVVSLCMILGVMAVPAHADNEAILEARKGILQVAQVIFVDGTEIGYANVGTGFLIGRAEGAQTVLTNYHVAHAHTEAEIRELLGSSIAANARIEFKIRVVVKRDVFINASIVNESYSADFCILKLEQPLYDRAPLTLGDSDNVNTTQDIYALGFPGIVSNIQLDTIYTADDVTVTSGIISKTNDVYLYDAPIPCITHSARLSGGNSGGPLVTEAGVVIGINTFISSDADGNNDYFYSVQINEVRDVLNALGIEYTFDETNGVGGAAEPAQTETTTTEESQTEESKAEEPVVTTPAPTESAKLPELKAAIDAARLVSLDGMSEESVANFRNALNDAETVYRNNGSDAEIDAAIRTLTAAQNGLVEAKKGLSTTAIVLIAVGAVLLIGLVVLLILLSANKKKKAEAESRSAVGRSQVPPVGGGFGQPQQGGWNAQAPQQPMQPRPQAPAYQQPQAPARPAQPNYFANPAEGAGETSVLADGAGETSVLNSGAGETTVLGGGVPAAYLVRKKNNERVTVNKQTFKIGKERRRVDYCIADNTSISRAHADIIFRGGEFFLKDNNATNGTYVNGSQVAAGGETKLANNDVIKLADEEFTFQK